MAKQNLKQKQKRLANVPYRLCLQIYRNELQSINRFIDVRQTYSVTRSFKRVHETWFRQVDRLTRSPFPRLFNPSFKALALCNFARHIKKITDDSNMARWSQKQPVNYTAQWSALDLVDDKTWFQILLPSILFTLR